LFFGCAVDRMFMPGKLAAVLRLLIMPPALQTIFSKRFMGRLFLGVLFVPALLYAQDTAVEMWEEPRHQLMLEMDHLRLVSVNIPAGDTSLFHQHRFATVYVLIADALVATQRKGDEGWKQPGERPLRAAGTLMDRSDYVNDPFAHRVRNQDDHALKLLALVNMSPALNSVGKEAEPRTLLDNTWFREHRLSVGAGAQSEALAFRNPAVVVQVSAGRSDAIPAVSTVERPSIQNLKTVPGAWSWHEGSPFRLRNLGTTRADFVIVEVKKPIGPE